MTSTNNCLSAYFRMEWSWCTCNMGPRNCDYCRAWFLPRYSCKVHCVHRMDDFFPTNCFSCVRWEFPVGGQRPGRRKLLLPTHSKVKPEPPQSAKLPRWAVIHHLIILHSRSIIIHIFFIWRPLPQSIVNTPLG